MRVTHYTEQDGGLWLEWRGKANRVPAHGCKRTACSPVEFGGKWVFALKYSNGMIWDVINGWRGVGPFIAARG